MRFGRSRLMYLIKRSCTDLIRKSQPLIASIGSRMSLPRSKPISNNVELHVKSTSNLSGRRGS